MSDRHRTRNVVVLLYPGCTVAEVIELTTRLHQAGMGLVHVAPTAESLVDRSGLRLEPDRPLGQVDPSTVDALVIPGGDPEAVIADDRALAFVAAVAAHGAVVAGICAGVLVMAAAGLVANRAITHNYRRPWAPTEIADVVDRFWVGAEVEADPTVGVVVDGPLVTALPNATVEFAMAVCQLLDLYTADEADLIARHLRGHFVPQLHDRS